MSCQGWTESGFMGPCSVSWLVLAILVFVVLISRKQIGENLGYTYNLIGGFVGVIVPFLIIITIFGTYKWAFLAGLVGSFIGGLFGGSIFGGSEEE